MSKQTAVEWLIGMISYTSKDTHSAMESSNFFDKAIAMEREQIEEAYQNGSEETYISCDSGCGGHYEIDISKEEYYEKTYGKEASHE